MYIQAEYWEFRPRIRCWKPWSLGLYLCKTVELSAISVARSISRCLFNDFGGPIYKTNAFLMYFFGPILKTHASLILFRTDTVKPLVLHHF